jgi:hypothetical protein
MQNGGLGYKDYYDMVEKSISKSENNNKQKIYSASTIRNKCENKRKEVLKNIKLESQRNPKTTKKISDFENETNPELRFLTCTSGKLLKYLIRLELQRYKKCQKDKKEQCKLQIVTKIQETNNFKLNTTNITNIIDNIVQNLESFKTKIENIKNTVIENKNKEKEIDYISGNQLITALKSASNIETNELTTTEIVQGINFGNELNKRTSGNNSYACYIMAGIIITVGFIIIVVTGGIVFEIFAAGAVLLGLCATTDFGNYTFSQLKNIYKSRKESQGLLDVKGIPKSAYISEIQLIIEIFKEFKTDIQVIHDYYISKDNNITNITNLCVYTNKTTCSVKRTHLNTIKKLLINMDNIFYIIETNDATTPAELIEAAENNDDGKILVNTEEE